MQRALCVSGFCLELFTPSFLRISPLCRPVLARYHGTCRDELACDHTHLLGSAMSWAVNEQVQGLLFNKVFVVLLWCAARDIVDCQHVWNRSSDRDPLPRLCRRCLSSCGNGRTCIVQVISCGVVGIAEKCAAAVIIPCSLAKSPRASGSGGWDLHCFVHEIVIGNEQVQGHLIWRLGSVLFCS